MESRNRKKLKTAVYTALQWTWGLPQTLAGAALYFVHRRDDHFNYRGATATVWDKDAGISLGKFIFVPKKAAGSDAVPSAHSSSAARGHKLSHTCLHKPGTFSVTSSSPCEASDRFLLDHEYGHTLQSLILGPFYLLLVGMPSMLWNRLPYYRNKRKRTGISYYSAPFEQTANTLAAKTGSRP